MRVELRELEDLLLGHEAVRDVAVIDREDAGGSKYLCAYVVMEGEVAPGALKAYLSEYVPDYLVPSAFIMLESLPRTLTGKVDRRALPAPGQLREPDEPEFVAPRTATEETIAGIWAEVLGVERIGVNDNFFQLGGHSLLATQVASRIHVAFQIDIPLRHIFESPTVAGLSVIVEEARASGEDEKIARLLERLEQLPEDEARAKLEELSLTGAGVDHTPDAGN
jgi:acyl carrier protein